MQASPDKAFFLSCDVGLQVRIKIENFQDERLQQRHRMMLDAELSTDEFSEARRLSELLHTDDCEYYVTCQLFAGNGFPLSLPTRTKHTSFSGSVKWHEWLTLPITYRDIPVDTVAAITVWDVAGPRKITAIGGTTVSLFGKKMELRKGIKKLQLWPGQVADARWDSSTPCQIQTPSDKDRLEKLDKRYHMGSINKLEWLDKLAFKTIDQLNREPAATQDRVFLFVEFPSFELPVLFFERKYHVAAMYGSSAMGLKTTSTAKKGWETEEQSRELMKVCDVAQELESPAQIQHQVMARFLTTSANGHSAEIDRELKPSKEERAHLADILRRPPTVPINPDDQFMVWRFRYYLAKENASALPKFCKVVDWDRPEQEKEATQVMQLWLTPPADVALELLTHEFSSKVLAKNSVPRDFAITILDTADDEELEYYLPQLVQALKYDVDFLNSDPCNLERFLIRRSAALPIGNFLGWYLRLESGAEEYGPMFQKVNERFVATMESGDDPKRTETWAKLTRSFEMFDKFEAAFKVIRSGGSKANQIKPLIREAFKTGEYSSLSKFDPVILPVDARVEVDGMIPDEIAVFKSKLLPIGIPFTTPIGEDMPSKLRINPPTAEVPKRTVKVIWKTGDDLRQDSLVIQMFSVMDRILKRENIDLKLTPYIIMPTSYNDDGNGMVELVTDSKDLADVFKEYKGDPINAYLRAHHPAEDPDPKGPTFGVDKEVYETYVKSTAGYCVMTYLLAIGDRHLNNLMLRTSGHLFHIDFGFILGRDPKPLPPSMKLTTEMVTAMGGYKGEYFQKFKSYCCEAFNILRKHANLIINLHVLMKDAHIPDFVKTGDQGIQVILERFRLDMTDEEAVQEFQALMNESVTAFMPKAMEVIHTWATYGR